MLHPMNFLISIEGDEFTGKTTVAVPAIARFFEKKEFVVQTSREPGGSEKGEAMRREIFEKLRQGTSPYDQAVLFNEARRVHINEVIRPFFAQDDRKVLVLDRYLDSTRIYQGFEGNVPFEKLFELEKKYVGSFFPQITVILYFPDNVIETAIQNRKPAAIKERKRRNEVIPFDTVTLQKHIQRQHNHLQLPLIAKRNNEHRDFVVVDASGSPDEVAHLITQNLAGVRLLV